MKKLYLGIIILIQLFILISNDDEVTLEIHKSPKHEDITGEELTPFVISLSSEDKQDKIKDVDLVLIIDNSKTMKDYNKLEYVKNSLKTLISFMGQNDRLALIMFDNSSTLIQDLELMNEENKNKTKIEIDNLKGSENKRNILEGLKMGLEILDKTDYKDGNRIASMILLSDGKDYYKKNDDIKEQFKDLISNSKIKNNVFTLHTLGYLNDHDSELMYDLSKLRDGGYFFIERVDLLDVFLLEIYGVLSTIFKVNVQLEINSLYKIRKIYGMEDFYNISPNKTSELNNYFSKEIMHLKNGKQYDFIILINDLKDIEEETEIFNVNIPSLNKNVKYKWKDNDEEPLVYDEYIRAISFDLFQKSYNTKNNPKIVSSDGISEIELGKSWIERQYNGISKDFWKEVYNFIIEDLNNFDDDGKPELLSLLHQLKTENPGILLDYNLYEEKLIKNLLSLEKPDNLNEISYKTYVQYETGTNYAYFYLESGIGKINGVRFSGEHSIIVLTSGNNNEKIRIETETETLKYYSWFKNVEKERIQTQIELNTGGKFAFKNDFPFHFYTSVDGKNDITFNIQFNELSFPPSSDDNNNKDYLKIEAYVLDDDSIKNFNYQPNKSIKKGYFDYGLKIGNIVLKKEEISKHLSSTNKNYLYIYVSKIEGDNERNYYYVEGQFSFVSMNSINLMNTYSKIPENFYIFSNLNEGENNPHLYELEMDQKIRIEFATSGNELDCKILKNKKYSPNSDELYKDNEEYSSNIQRIDGMGKTYIDVTQKNSEDNIIISIFSKNGNHIAGKEIQRLAYVVRYSKSSNYGIYDFNDTEDKNGEITIKKDEENENNYIISFNHLKSKKYGESQFVQENTKFIFKLYPITSRIKIYNTISIFEDKVKIYKELELKDNEEGQFIISDDDDNQEQLNEDENYYFIILTISKKNNEIISYNNKYNKIFGIIENEIFIGDEEPYHNQLFKETILTFKISDKSEKKYLEVKISDFDGGKYGYLYIRIGDKKYKSTQHLNHNIVVIPREICEGKNIEVEIKLKDGEETDYFFSIELVDNVIINFGENFFFEMLPEYNGRVSVEVKRKNDNDKNENFNVFVQSTNGDLEIQGFIKNEFFGAMSSNYLALKGKTFEIRAKTGEMISLYTHIIDNTKKFIPRDYDINIYGYLQQIYCIYFDDFNIEKYQIRILGDKEISVKYNSEKKEDTESKILYLKEFNNEKLNEICLEPKKSLDSIFFNIQIIDISKQTKSTSIVQPILFDAIYKDELSKNEIRFYKQGLFDSNQNEELKYLYNIHQKEGEIKVYVTNCKDYPDCDFTKDSLENLENDGKAISLYNINGLFVHSKVSENYDSNDSENMLIYVVLCLSNLCKYDFILNKSTSIINLSKFGKFTSQINKNMIDKYYIEKNDNIDYITITLYTFSGEVMLRTNDKCENITHTIFGHMEKYEIPKIEIEHSFELYVQAINDSVYTIEYQESTNDKNNDIKNIKIKSKFVNFLNITEETLIEFSPLTDSYSIKFIPINCDIQVKYDTDSYLNFQNKIYYYDTNYYEKLSNKFTITSEYKECLIYTYLEEFTENNYPVLSDKVPYYLTLNKKTKNYQLMYPLPNRFYEPMYRFNFFEEVPIKINNKIKNKKDNEINAIAMKDIKPSSNLTENCYGVFDDGICYLILEINYDGDTSNPIILEIIPKSLNNVPSVLSSNQMRQDFIKINGDQKYMAKILQNEEGEVDFNYKFYSGELIAKLIVIDKKSWKNRYDLPEKYEQLKYDNLKQKIVFTKKQTAICIHGCYLFLEVNCLESFKEEKYEEGVNMDYSIYFKKNDANSIVQLRLNEIEYGTLSKTIDENYFKYYSIEIPYSTDKIILDFNSDNAKALIKFGTEKPKINDKDYLIEKSQTLIIEKESEKGFPHKTLTIGIYTNKLENKVSQYSFRIRVENKYIKNYIYTDSNNENICETTEDNESCYFLIPIINVQQYANLLIYGLSKKSEELIISYKKINLGQDNNDDKYEKTSEGEFIQNMLIIKNDELKLNENENILVKVFSPSKGRITLLYTFKSYLKECLLHPDNKVLYSMNPNEELYLDMPDGLKSLVQINVIDGKGYIGYEEDDNNKLKEISGKYSSIYLQSDENDENKRIKVTTDLKNSFYFYTSLKINSNKRNINDMSNGGSSLKTIKGFPIEFYSKITENKDYTINFNINNIKKNTDEKSNLCDFSIEAYVVSEEIIDKLTNDDTYVYIGDGFQGKYESGFGISRLDLSKEQIKKYYTKDNNNYIYIIVEASRKNPSILNQINGEISIFENNNLDNVAPDNVYINGNLLSNENLINKYKIIKKNEKDTIIRVEFSAPSEIVKYKFYTEKNNNIPSEEKNYLGKKNIDIDVKDITEPIIFEIFSSDTKEKDKNKLSYSFRYRTDEDVKSFKTYETYGDTKGKCEKKEIGKNPNNNIKSIELTIPAINEENSYRNLLENENNEIDNSINYYLKIYTCSDEEKKMLANSNTISIIDGMEYYKDYEFSFNDTECKRTIDIPYNKNVYITIKAMTPDKELLSYESILFDREDNKQDNNNDNNDNKPDNDNTEIYNESKFRLIIIIILASIIGIIFIFVIVHYLLKQRKNKVEEINRIDTNNNLNEILPSIDENSLK